MIRIFPYVLLGGAYIAKVTSYLGMEDGLTGIITAVVSLASTFQIFAIFLAHKKPVKRWVTIWHSINQLFFACVYLVPFFKFSKNVKIFLFIVFFLVGNIINQIINAPKINWFMSLVDENKRGSFTAKKEVVSLIGGMIFSFIIGSAMDYYETIGNSVAAFTFCSIGIFVLTLLHTGSLLFSKEKTVESCEEYNVKNIFSGLFRNKGLMKIIILTSLWKVATFLSTPFYGTYQIKELAFSMAFISILSAVTAIFRSVVSRPVGRLADKSFTSALKVCYFFGGLAFTVNIFTVPSNGKLFFVLYYLFYAIASAGIDNCEMNLAYSMVQEEQRTAALALRMAVSGLVGFLTTLAISPLVSYIQNNGNQIFGLNVYAQQVVSAMSVFVVILTLIYFYKNEKVIDCQDKFKEKGNVRDKKM